MADRDIRVHEYARRIFAGQELYCVESGREARNRLEPAGNRIGEPAGTATAGGMENGTAVNLLVCSPTLASPEPNGAELVRWFRSIAPDTPILWHADKTEPPNAVEGLAHLTKAPKVYMVFDQGILVDELMLKATALDILEGKQSLDEVCRQALAKGPRASLEGLDLSLQVGVYVRVAASPKEDGLIHLMAFARTGHLPDEQLVEIFRYIGPERLAHQGLIVPRAAEIRF